MQIPTAVRENLQFLVAEVIAQCKTLRKALVRENPSGVQRLIDRAGYASNLKGRVQSGTISHIAQHDIDDARTRIQLGEYAEIAHQLERVTDKFRDIGRQYLEVEHVQVISGQRFKTPLTRIAETLNNLADDLPPTTGESAMALTRCARRLEQQADKLHNDFVSGLGQHPKYASDVSRGILMTHSLKQIGDCVLRISESLLTMQLGRQMSFDRYKSLQSLISDNPEFSDAEVNTIAATRSGSSISGLRSKVPGKTAAVFKDGLRRKLREERKGVESWHQVFPGLAPRILDYRKRGESAALLIEHLPGITFEQILIKESEPLLRAASKALQNTLKDVWKATRSADQVSAKFMSQLDDRLPEIRSAHGSLLQDGAKIGRFRQPSFEQLMKRAAKAESRIPPSFSVYIHGDFNVDNIIYDADADRIHFIDLHRSRYMDYLQDVSVFMVSCFRLPGRDDDANERVQIAIAEMDRTARRFAQRNEDDYYDFRLSLGLARSFATSTRFIADRKVARSMLARSRWLMNCVLDIDPAYAGEFKLPIKELFRDTSPR